MVKYKLDMDDEVCMCKWIHDDVDDEYTKRETRNTHVHKKRGSIKNI